jgi:hypothetical protein
LLHHDGAAFRRRAYRAAAPVSPAYAREGKSGVVAVVGIFLLYDRWQFDMGCSPAVKHQRPPKI